MSSKIKKCTECGKSKSVDCFYSSGRRTTNGEIVYRGECKSCHKIRKKRNLTTEKIIRKRAYGLIERLSNTNNAKNKCYENVNCKIGDNVQEVYDYLLRFKNDLKKLIKANKTPSVDRIDSNKGYIDGNIQIISFRENYLDGIKKASEARKKPVKVILKNNEEIKFDSVSDCSQKLDMKRGTIIKHRDNQTTCKKGFRFVDLS